VSPAVGTIGRVLVHETLAILASDLRDLLLRHLTLGRHSVSRHWLTVARIHRLTVSRIGIVSLVVSGRSIALLHRISSWHVAWHLLRHTSCGDERYLSATCEVGATFALQHSLETILDRRSSSSCATGRHSNAKWERLGGTLAEVGRSSHLHISGEQNVFGTVHFLDPLTVGKRYPHGFLVGLEHPCFHLDSFALNVFVSFNIDLSYDRLSFCKSCLVESYPDFTLWRNQMIEQTQGLSFPTLNHRFPKTRIKKA